MKAFPSEHPILGTMNTFEDGMDLRDYFAAKAMQGFLAEGTMFGQKQGESQADACANASYEWADAMMKAREQ